MTAKEYTRGKARELRFQHKLQLALGTVLVLVIERMAVDRTIAAQVISVAAQATLPRNAMSCKV